MELKGFDWSTSQTRASDDLDKKLPSETANTVIVVAWNKKEKMTSKLPKVISEIHSEDLSVIVNILYSLTLGFVFFALFIALRRKLKVAYSPLVNSRRWATKEI